MATWGCLQRSGKAWMNSLMALKCLQKKRFGFYRSSPPPHHLYWSRWLLLLFWLDLKLRALLLWLRGADSSPVITLNSRFVFLCDASPKIKLLATANTGALKPVNDITVTMPIIYVHSLCSKAGSVDASAISLFLLKKKQPLSFHRHLDCLVHRLVTHVD